MQMTFDITSISLRRVYFKIGNFCESCFGGRAIGLTWGRESCIYRPIAIAYTSCWSNHSPQANHVWAHRTQQRILNTYCKVIAKAPVTPGLRPGYDQPATETWANRRKNVRLVAEVVRLVAEVVGDRKGKISRNKVVVMFKTRSHRAYDQVTTYLRSKNVGMMGQS